MSMCTKNLHAQLVHVNFIAYSLQSLTDRNINKTIISSVLTPLTDKTLVELYHIILMLLILFPEIDT